MVVVPKVRLYRQPLSFLLLPSTRVRVRVRVGVRASRPLLLSSSWLPVVLVKILALVLASPVRYQ